MSTFHNLKSLHVKRELQQDNIQTDSEKRTSTPDSTPQARSHTSKPKRSSPIPKSTSPRPEEPKRPLIRKTIPNEPDRPTLSNNDTNIPNPKNSRKESPPGSKPKEDARKGQADHVKHRIHLRHSSRLLSKLLHPQAESSQRHDKKEPQHETKEAVKKAEKRVEKSTLTQNEKPQLIKDKKKEETKTLKERRKSFRENNPERLKLQKLRTSQGFAVRRVGAGPPFNADTEAKVVHLTADDAGERARLSGKILARLTEQLRLVTGLKGSEPERLRRWRVRNEKKRLVPTIALVGGRERGVVRTVESKAQDIDRVGNVKSKLSPNTSYTLTPADLLATHMTNLHRRRASHRSPSGLDFVMRSIRLDPVSPQTQSHSPPLRNFQWFLSHLHGGLGVITKRTRLLSAQLSRYLRDPTIRISRRAAGMPARSCLTKSVPSSRLRHILGVIQGRAKRIIKRNQMLSAQVSAYHPHTPVPLAKHAARILPRSKISRRPVQLTTPTNPTQHSDSTPQNAERLTARKVLLPARLRRIAAQPPREKMRYGDGRAFAGARWSTLRPRVRRKGFRNQREHLRSHLVGGRAEARKVTVRSREERLEDDVAEWLGSRGM
ncbi:hypothetical protein BU25DRAFT_457743 [Macroventuria anomochaeta]|uniref:Uncharacterized protein n=1 Tax=Macroventuria anomochaeta TaxID=301207 RepID=A0ACB6S311_9PLEO|nr:uncharacterized protein BU25DRAFT_457743 [Macroventuria anomochaeta]KAF2628414.1 hypothetical protein BU25DRAFT_457743 [Macroventuria anomochaeta]